MDPNIDLKTLARCNQENTQIESWGKERLKVPFDVGAHDFLRFGKSEGGRYMAGLIKCERRSESLAR